MPNSQNITQNSSKNNSQSQPKLENEIYDSPDNSTNFITDLTKNELDRQKNCLNLIASENIPSTKVLEFMGSVWSNKYGEGYPGKRYYAGNEFTDNLESFVQKKALEVFDTQIRLNVPLARGVSVAKGGILSSSQNPEFLGSTSDYAVNVQVLSGSPANAMVFLSVLEYGDTILSLNLANGGHLSHLHATSNWNKFFKLINYDVKLVENIENQDLNSEKNLQKENTLNFDKIVNQIQQKINQFQQQNSKKNLENQQKHKKNIDFIKRELHKIKTLNLKNPKVEFFASGQCNDLYLVVENNQKYLAKITNWEQNKIWKIKQEEFEKLNFIKKLKIAPTSYYFDLGNNSEQIHWNLVDFVEGNPIKSFSSNNIIQLAKILKKLHENTIKKEHGDRWFSLEQIPYKSYVLKEYSENKPKFVQKIGYNNLKESFEAINWQEIKQFCLIHNDLKPLNIVENNGLISLIDWEYAYMDIPENDIARFFVENSLIESQKQLFLKNYLPLENLDFKMERLEVLVRLYEFFEIGKDVVEPIYNENLNSQKPFIIAIDGRSGSGKSTLATKMEKLLPNSKRFNLDAFDLNGGDFFSPKNIEKNFEIDFENRCFDAAKIQQEIAQNDYKIVILEETFGFKNLPEIDFDLKIWVKLEKEIAANRLNNREINERIEIDPKLIKLSTQKWQIAENRYLQNFKPQQQADIIISTENENYEILRNNLEINEFTKGLPGLNSQLKTIHLIGLFSDSDKYSRLEDWVKMIELAAQNGAEKIVLHLITDGIDTDKKLVDIWQEFTMILKSKIQNSNQGHKLWEDLEKNILFLGSLSGRNFTMSTDENWGKISNGLTALFSSEQKITKNLLYSFLSQKYSFEQKIKPLAFIDIEIPECFGEEKTPIIDIISEIVNYNNNQGIFEEKNIIPIDNYGLGECIDFNDTIYLINHTAQDFEKFTKILVNINKEFDLNLNILANFESVIEGVQFCPVEAETPCGPSDATTPVFTLPHFVHEGNLDFANQITLTKNQVCWEIDEADFEAKLIEFKPKLTILGGSSYPRLINFARLTKIAHRHGSLILADVAHINGLIASGLHFSPFQSGELANFGADFVTMTTHKTLRGPRGAMIFMKKEWEKTINKTIFPGTSGGPHFNKIAAIGQSCLEILGEDFYPDGVSFDDYSQNVLETCKALENSLAKNGLEIISPTQNHLCLIKLPDNSDSLEIQQKLEKIGIICNRNVLPFDKKSAWRPSGLRLGTAALTSRGLTIEMAEKIGKIIADVIFEAETEENLKKEVENLVKSLNWWY